MKNAERDQHIRIEIGVHMRVQIRAKLAFAADVGFDERFFGVQTVVLCLAHQGFGDGGNVRLALDRAVGIDIRHLGVRQPQHIDRAVALVDIARHLAGDDFQPVLTGAQRQSAEVRKIRDQIALGMIGRAQHIGHALLRQAQLNDDVLFLIQIKRSEQSHSIPPHSFFSL